MGHRPNMYRIRDHERLARWMRANGISGRQLSRDVGCSPNTVAWLCKGRIDRVNEYIARRLCTVLDVPLDDLFEATESVAWQRTKGAIKGTTGRHSMSPET